MITVAELQRFIIWCCGSVIVFGFIATLVAYLIYGGSKCDATNKECIATQKTNAISQESNDKLKVAAPLLIVLGIFVLVLVRCWQRTSSTRTVTANSSPDGEENNAYDGNECKRMFVIFVYNHCLVLR